MNTFIIITFLALFSLHSIMIISRHLSVFRIELRHGKKGNRVKFTIHIFGVMRSIVQGALAYLVYTLLEYMNVESSIFTLSDLEVSLILAVSIPLILLFILRFIYYIIIIFSELTYNSNVERYVIKRNKGK
jgi:hypothetical protein